MRIIFALVCLTLVMAQPLTTQAQDRGQGQERSLGLNDPDWRFDIYGYLWAINLKGSMGVGDNTGNVYMSFSDIVDKLDMGAFVFFQARKQRWNILTDLAYADISDDGYLPVPPPPPNQDPVAATMKMKLLLWDFAGAYGLGDGFYPSGWQLMFGGKYVSINPGLNVTGVGNFDEANTWIEPYLGLRFLTNANRWFANLRLDYGGFGVGSEVYWHFMTGVGYQFANKWSTNVSYRIMSFDYEDSSNGFIFDAEIAGWQVGIGFHF